MRILLAAALAAAAALCVRCSSRGETPRAKHLLLITVDTLRRDRLGCYGGPNHPSPAIDALAARGTTFDAAYSPRGMTLPSMTTFFTSRYPAEHGVINNKKPVPDSELMLAERLTEQGFRTHAFQASGVLHPQRSNVQQGFAKADYEFERFPDQDEPMATVAADWIERNFGRTKQREFLWIHFMAPHKPYAPPRSILDRLDPGYVGLFDADKDLDRIFVDKVALAPRDKQHLLAAYDGEVAVVDNCVRRLVDALEKSGAAKDTLLVFAADHGEETYSHNCYFYHAASPYRSVTSIPWICVQDGTVATQRVPGIVETVDFLPTVLGWLAVDPTGFSMRGNDLGEVLTGKGVVRKDLAFSRIDDVDDTDTKGVGVLAVRSREWSYVVNPSGFVPKWPPEEGVYPIPTRALYHLTTDPDEQGDVAAQNEDVCRSMQAAAIAWYTSLHMGSVANRALTDEDKRLFKELGY